MKTEVTQEQIDSYRQNGFVLIEDLLTAQELEEWRDAVGEAVENRGRQRILGRSETTSDDDYYNNVFTQRVNLWTWN